MSERPRLDVGEVLRRHGPAYEAAHGARLSAEQRRVLRDLAACRTAALGGHVERCAGCGQERVAYNSCRNRHCPKCQALARAAWLAREASYLLPVEYHHVVFTLPAEVAALARHSPAVVYHLLFRAASATLREVAADPRHLGAEVGVLAVLHTWGQDLRHHPHLHCVVTGGGLACDARGRPAALPRWVSCRPGFFLPVRVLGRLFRGKFLALLRQAFEAGRLAAPGALAAWLGPLYRKEWVVYAKPPFGGPAVVLKYLARYTHRVAISNHRLLAVAGGQVTFAWRDYAHGGRQRRLTVSAEEFIRRLLLHVLPRGFVKVRHYGLLANRGRDGKLARCRWLLALAGLAARAAGVAAAAPEARCPACGGGPLVVVQVLPPCAAPGACPPQGEDTS
jgi:hypothetical protein